MAISGYGTMPSSGARTSSSNSRTAAIALAAVAGLLVAACALTMSASSPKETALLGYDPFGEISNPGHSDINNDFEGEDTEQLPSWATEWQESEGRPCSGADCEDSVNPLGALGRWVMVKTAPHFNTEKDRHQRHSCEGLPGWALQECMKVREYEATLDHAGREKPAEEEEEEEAEDADGEEGEEGGQEESEERARPMTLKAMRQHPSVLAALPQRNQRIAQAQRRVKV